MFLTCSVGFCLDGGPKIDSIFFVTKFHNYWWKLALHDYIWHLWLNTICLESFYWKCPPLYKPQDFHVLV